MCDLCAYKLQYPCYHLLICAQLTTLSSSLLLSVLQEEMNTWISAITAAVSGDKSEVTPSSHSTPAPAARAQTLPASVATAAAESSPGKREKDKEKRFSLFSKKK